MAEGKKPSAKIQAGKKAKKIPWKIGPRCAGFHTRLLSNSGRYGRFRPYPGPLPDTLWRSPRICRDHGLGDHHYYILFFCFFKGIFRGRVAFIVGPPVEASGRSPLHLLCPSPDSEMIPFLYPGPGKFLIFLARWDMRIMKESQGETAQEKEDTNGDRYHRRAGGRRQEHGRQDVGEAAQIPLPGHGSHVPGGGSSGPGAGNQPGRRRRLWSACVATWILTFEET